MSLPWFRFFPADHVMETAHLPLNVKGAYIDLICHYARFGSLPALDTHLAEILHLKLGEWLREYKPRLEPLFSDGWKSERIEREFENAKKRYEKAKNAAERRWSDVSEHAPSNAPSIAPEMLTRTRTRFGSARSKFALPADRDLDNNIDWEADLDRSDRAVLRTNSGRVIK